MENLRILYCPVVLVAGSAQLDQNLSKIFRLQSEIQTSKMQVLKAVSKMVCNVDNTCTPAHTQSIETMQFSRQFDIYDQGLTM